MAEPVAYCLQCGHVAARIVGHALGGYPIVDCRYVVKVKGKDEYRGCGRVPGTFDPDQAVQAALNRRAIAARKAHARGAHAKKPVLGCDRCQATIDHRAHLRDGIAWADCPLCQLAQERTAPARHAR